MFRFREWQVYKDARQFRREINQLVKTFPKEEKFLLIDQLKRAVNSIVLNIAEGAGRTTARDVNLFLNRAQTSANEVVACLDCALDDGFISKDVRDNYLKKTENIVKQLRAFGNSLLKNA